MSEWMKLERLPQNSLPTPKYESAQSAGFDFAACLTRPCKIVKANGKQNFVVNDEADRILVDQSWEPCHKKPLLIIGPDETIMVPLGFKSEFGNRYVLQLHVRSSVGISGLMLANGTGIVDPDYRGELFAVLWNRHNYAIPVSHGERIVQGVLTQFTRAVINEVGNVRKTDRGEGGFGSTGQHVTPQETVVGPQL